MMPLFPLTPRYRLDDELPWLEGIDPSRHYWIRVNSEAQLTIAIPGLVTASLAEFRETLLRFRALTAGETMHLTRSATSCTIHCISDNCFALAGTVQSAPVWHLFDRETLESLLMTSHPDWQCAPRDMELGRQMLMRSWQQTVAA